MPDLIVCFDNLPPRATAILVCRGSALGPVVARFPLTADGMAAAMRLAKGR